MKFSLCSKICLRVQQVKAPAYSIEFFYNGNDIKILGSQDVKSQLCGLCGNFDKVRQSISQL
jgi:hypothetical protein